MSLILRNGYRSEPRVKKNVKLLINADVNDIFYEDVNLGKVSMSTSPFFGLSAQRQSP